MRFLSILPKAAATTVLESRRLVSKRVIGRNGGGLLVPKVCRCAASVPAFDDRSTSTRRTARRRERGRRKNFRKNFSWARTARLTTLAIPTSSLGSATGRVGGDERTQTGRERATEEKCRRQRKSDAGTASKSRLTRETGRSRRFRRRRKRKVCAK